MRTEALGLVAVGERLPMLPNLPEEQATQAGQVRVAPVVTVASGRTFGDVSIVVWPNSLVQTRLVAVGN